MIVISARTRDTRGAFNSTKDAATYEEHLLFSHRAHFALVSDKEKAGRGAADTDGKELGKRAAKNKRDQQALLERVDEMLATPVFVDENKVRQLCSFGLCRIICIFTLQAVRCAEQIVDEKRGKSIICAKTFNLASSVTTHMREHEDSGWTCKKCGVNTNTRQEQEKHMLTHEPIVCCPVPDVAGHKTMTRISCATSTAKRRTGPPLDAKQKAEYCEQAKKLFKDGYAAIIEALKAKQKAAQQNS